jgi:hypothetical protein
MNYVRRTVYVRIRHEAKRNRGKKGSKYLTDTMKQDRMKDNCNISRIYDCFPRSEGTEHLQHVQEKAVTEKHPNTIGNFHWFFEQDACFVLC